MRKLHDAGCLPTHDQLEINALLDDITMIWLSDKNIDINHGTVSATPQECSFFFLCGRARR